MSEEIKNSGEEASASGEERAQVSQAVVRRLPRYFRYLRELIRQGKMRISSAELSHLMNVTASQIRQDLNCFGGFGQQGYGYRVDYLYAKICELLGVDAGVQAIVVGAGDLGRAIVRSSMFDKRGVSLISLFDVSPELVGKKVGGILVRDMKELEQFLETTPADMAVLTLPKDKVTEVSHRLVKAGIKALWNFTGKELDFDPNEVAVENVHLGDSLMILNYRLTRNADGSRRKEYQKEKKEDGSENDPNA